ncbi:hypothetical protein [Roseimicrobium sp. ORNL1]|nr:hypothetical protein [Roseimicrobium sp. ORNL1]QIF00336.1 hypothetical protein G5S37_01940 [Roseimicrobium sp. ORNL1]
MFRKLTETCLMRVAMGKVVIHDWDDVKEKLGKRVTQSAKAESADG